MMEQALGKLSKALLALALAAGLGTAYAAGDHGGYGQQQDTPKDCAKNPNDPRCKSGK
jgi:hypothetical protein